SYDKPSNVHERITPGFGADLESRSGEKAVPAPKGRQQPFVMLCLCGSHFLYSFNWRVNVSMDLLSSLISFISLSLYFLVSLSEVRWFPSRSTVFLLLTIASVHRDSSLWRYSIF